MRINLPILKQDIVDGKIVSDKRYVSFDLDTSVYSEERWEQHFPILAAREGLFQYIEKVQENSISDRVKVASMLKAVFCFIESDEIQTYKEFAKMFNLATPEYTTELVNTLYSAFKLVIGSSSVKN